MTSATATNEKVKFTSAKRTFWTGKTKRETRTFLSSGAASMNDMRAWLVDSDMKENVMLPRMR